VGKRLIEFQTEVELRFGEMQGSQARLEGQVEGVQGAVTSVEGRVSVVDERVQGEKFWMFGTTHQFRLLKRRCCMRPIMLCTKP